MEHQTCNLCRATFSTAGAELLVKDGHPIVRCPACGLLFRSTMPSAQELRALYDDDYFGGREAPTRRDGYLDYLADEAVHRANAKRRLERLAAFVDRGRLLDVGCAAGFFVDEASRLGWDATGIDVSDAMVDWGRQHLAADLRIGTLREAPLDPSASCVTMWDYIEHAIDPRGDVERAFTLLRPRGVVALSTGDVGSALARVSLARWHLMTPRHHNFFFSRRTITRLLESVGFEIAYVGHPGAVFPIRYLAHKLCLTVDVAILDRLAQRLARSRLGGRVLPVNLWDVMTVVARRPATAA